MSQHNGLNETVNQGREQTGGYTATIASFNALATWRERERERVLAWLHVEQSMSIKHKRQFSSVMVSLRRSHKKHIKQTAEAQ